MKLALLAVVSAAALHGAILRGVVVERQTGKTLARALIAVHPVAGAAGATRSVRSNPYGAFEFPPMPAGIYLVTVSRKGFAPLQYGQQQWKGAGTPVVLRDSDETVLRIALPRFGAIVGRISDEADVGLVEHEVLAYRNTRPPVMVAKAATDDRGVYRLHDLEPGVYLVRTAAKQYDDGGYLPTFYKESATAERANPVEVTLDRDTVDVNIRPTPGTLYTIAGQVRGAGTPPNPVEVSLVSDMGVESVTTDSSGRFQFKPAAPGKFEVLARTAQATAWLPIEMDRDRTETLLRMEPMPNVAFAFEEAGGASVDVTGLLLMARRKDLSGSGAIEYLQPGAARTPLLPGRWEFSLAPNEAYYTRGWSESLITAAAPAAVKVTVGAHPGALHGTVTSATREPAAGAPVYLERDGEIRTAHTDIHGAYRFVGLAPGAYRLLSTLDAPQWDGARTVQIEESANLAQDLQLPAQP